MGVYPPFWAQLQWNVHFKLIKGYDQIFAFTMWPDTTYITTLQIYPIKWAIDVLLSIGTRPQGSSVGQCKPFAQGILFSSIYPWENQEFNLALLNWLRFAFVFVRKKYHVSPSILRQIFSINLLMMETCFLPLWLWSVLCFSSIYTHIYLVYFL